MMMKIENHTDWTDYMLRRLVAWCCKQADLPQRCIKLAVFKNTKKVCNGEHAFSGRAWYRSRKIRTSIGSDSKFPYTFTAYGDHEETFADRIEALVGVTAHEVIHHAAIKPSSKYYQSTRSNGRGTGSSEYYTRRAECEILNVFRASRDALMAEWSITPEPKAVKPKADPMDIKAARAQSLLDEWTRKMKLARTKCRKYQTRVRYYERKAASRQPSEAANAK